MRTLYTIGFAGWSAQAFFDALKRAGVRTVTDIRRRPTSQLAGFAKQRDLRYFCELHGIGYQHYLQWAPSDALLDDWKNQRLDWPQYESRFAAELARSTFDVIAAPDELDRTCLLCSEPLPAQCHRRLVADHLVQTLPGGAWEVSHLTPFSGRHTDAE